MAQRAPRNEFAPPPQGGTFRALTLALLAHLLLVLALAWGLNWRQQSSGETFEAELWSAPPPPPVPVPVRPPPQPQPVPAPTREADIALEQQRKAEAERRAEQQRQQELQRRQQAAEQARLLQQQQAEERRAAEEAQRKQEEARRKQEEAARQAQAERQAKADAERKAAAARHKAEIDRLRQLAGNDGLATGNGGAPSSGYGDKVRAAVFDHIAFPDQIDGNPVAEVEVRTAPEGTIVGRRLLRSSGIKTWDDAVLKAIDKTQTMPRDIDGRVPPVIIIEFRPNNR